MHSFNRYASTHSLAKYEYSVTVNVIAVIDRDYKSKVMSRDLPKFRRQVANFMADHRARAAIFAGLLQQRPLTTSLIAGEGWGVT